MKKGNKITNVEIVLTANEIKELREKTKMYEFKSINSYVKFKLFVITPITEKIEELLNHVKRI